MSQYYDQNSYFHAAGNQLPQAAEVDQAEQSSSFSGNILFWTSDDLRETTLWGQEPVPNHQQQIAAYPSPPNAHHEPPPQRTTGFSITTPAGYSVQTKTFIQPQHGGPGAEFWWATLTQLGLCSYKGTHIPMAHFMQRGSSRDCSRFYVPDDGRCLEWCRDSADAQTFTLFDVPAGKIYAQYSGGPFESKDLHPYMQYHFSADDPLLLFAVIGITIRRWTDIYGF